MLKKLTIVVFTFVFFLFLVGLEPVSGQDTRPTPTNVPPPGEGGEPGGSIRGTVYLDVGQDGNCTGDPVISGIPIEFTSNDGGTTVYLSSGANGTYGLVAAGLGTWQVSVVPPAGYVAVSTPTTSVFLSADTPVATGVDFCISTTDGTTTETTTGTTSGGSAGTGQSSAPVVLPASGEASNSSGWLIGLGVVGLALIGAGLFIQARRRTG